MTDQTAGPNENSNNLGAALRAEVPSAGPNFWSDVDTRFASVAADDAEMPTPIDIATHVGDSNNVQRVAGQQKLAVWPLALAAAAMIIAGVFIGNRLSTSTEGEIDVGYTSDETSVPIEDLPGPTVNFDHWHSVYGVWDCTANDGAGDWVPEFQSTRDDSGIHSHGDGLIHLHPFFEWSAGKNARLGIWADEMGISIDDDEITLDDGRVLSEGQSCSANGGEPAVVHIRRWTLDVQLLADPTTPPTVITTDLANERFYNDREVWTIAYAPLDAEIPLPPTERFTTLNNSVAPADVDQLPDVITSGIRLTDRLPPAPPVGFDPESSIEDQLRQLPNLVGSATDTALEVPAAGGYAQFVPLTSGLDAFAMLEDRAAQANQDLTPSIHGASTIANTADVQHLVAASSDGRNHEVYLYQATKADEPDTLLDCSSIAEQSQFFAIPIIGCREGAGLSRGVTFSMGLTEGSSFALLTGIDPAGVWLLVELSDGRTMVANTAAAASFVAWGGEADVVEATIFDVDLNQIWTETINE